MALDHDPFEADDPPPVPPGGLDARAMLDLMLVSEGARRLWRAEDAISLSTQAEREAICQWLGGMLHRPPLDGARSGPWRAVRALVEALWWDLADRTPDPLEPLALSPAILPSHPWGPGSDA